MVLLENESFLSELTRLFQKSRTSGSISLTMKRYDGRVKPKPRATATAAKSSVKSNKASQHSTDAEYRCLIRAVLGSKKISTVIAQKDVNKFQLAYCNLLKGNMDGLKKKEKAAKSKAKVQAI